MPFISLKEREALLRQRQGSRRTSSVGFFSFPKAKLGFAVFAIFAMASFGTIVFEPAENAWAGLLYGFIAAMGLLVPWLLHRASGHGDQRELLEQEVRLERAQRIALALQTAKSHSASIRDLQAHLRWTEEAIVDGLRGAMDRGLIFEDYDATSMQYFFVSSAVYLTPEDAHASFDARLNAPRPSDEYRSAATPQTRSEPAGMSNSTSDSEAQWSETPEEEVASSSPDKVTHRF